MIWHPQRISGGSPSTEWLRVPSWVESQTDTVARRQRGRWLHQRGRLLTSQATGPAVYRDWQPPFRLSRHARATCGTLRAFGRSMLAYRAYQILFGCRKVGRGALLGRPEALEVSPAADKLYTRGDQDR